VSKRLEKSSFRCGADPAVLALATIVVFFSAIIIVGIQRIAGFDLVLPVARR
jgi:hypothetical protein